MVFLQCPVVFLWSFYTTQWSSLVFLCCPDATQTRDRHDGDVFTLCYAFGKNIPVPKGKPFETLHYSRSIFNPLSIETVALFLINGRGFLWLIFLFVIALCFLNDVLTIPKLLRFFFHHFVQFWIRELNA